MALQKAGDSAAAAACLSESAQKLERIGTDVLLLATNTMHKVADEIQAAVQVPLLHLVDATAEAVKARQAWLTVGFARHPIHHERRFLQPPHAAAGRAHFGARETQQAEIHRVIFDELCPSAAFEAEAKAYYLDVIEDLRTQGAEGVILGCTEIGLCWNPEDCALPLFDSAEIHAHSAVDFVLQC